MPVAEVFPVATEFVPDRQEGVWVEIGYDEDDLGVQTVQLWSLEGPGG
jgi:hypothetical protein